MMKPLRESSRPALRQCAGKIAAEATQWWLGCGDDSQEQRGAELILQMHDLVDCADILGPCVKCYITVSVAACCVCIGAAAAVAALSQLLLDA